MRKIETVWHYILYSALKEKKYKHTQKEIAEDFNYSISTVHHALEVPYKMGAIRKTSKFFVLEDFDKLLYYWASRRNLNNNVVYKTYVDFPVLEIEGLIPPDSVYAGYTAARNILKEPPADYSKVYMYIKKTNLEMLKQRFVNNLKNPNLFVLSMPDIMFNYGNITTLPHTFVDIWNMQDWYAKDFVKALEQRIHAVLS